MGKMRLSFIDSGVPFKASLTVYKLDYFANNLICVPYLYCIIFTYIQFILIFTYL